MSVQRRARLREAWTDDVGRPGSSVSRYLFCYYCNSTSSIAWPLVETSAIVASRRQTVRLVLAEGERGNAGGG